MTRQGVDVCYEIHPGEDLLDGASFERFLAKVDNHPRCCINYDPSHFVLQALDYLQFIDFYHERIKAFHVKDAELNPDGRQGVFSGFEDWADRAGRFRSLGDGQVDLGGIFSKLTKYGYGSWAVLEWECCLKNPEDGAREGAELIAAHIIKVTEKSFEDFAGGASDEARQPPRARPRPVTRRRRLRLGMVGGGQGALIGAVHRLAARMDDRYELVAGCFSSTPERSRASAAELGVAAERAYATFAEMAERERERADGIDVVSIVTPNHLHLPAARAFLAAGIHVLCDKPLTTNVADAEELVRLVEDSGRVFVLTHNYPSYPMVRAARAMVAAGQLGRLRVVQVEYPQEWLASPIEQSGQKQAEWRTDPVRSGPGGTVADIGTHAINLACFITGLELRELAADVNIFVDGRRVDDNIHAHAALPRWRHRNAVGEPGGAGPWQQPEDPGLWRPGEPELGAGGSGPSALHRAGRVAAHDRPRQPWRRACGGAADAYSRWLPGRFPRGIRQSVRRRRGADLGQERGPRSRAGRGAAADGARRAGGHAVHRGGAAVGPEQRRLDQDRTMTQREGNNSRGE